MSSDMTNGPVKPLNKLTKRELIDLCVARMQDRVRLRQEMDENKVTFNSQFNELSSEFNRVVRLNNDKTKDLSIMQSALNDVEEKNRALNSQIIDLRKALKTTSQFL